MSNEFWIGLLIQLVVYGVSIGVIYGVMRTRLDYIENNRIKDLEEWQTYEQRKE